MSVATRLMLGISLVTVPTVVFGGLAVLGVVTSGTAGLAFDVQLTPVQVSLYRAGHAHAGVLLILSLVLQIALDYARLPAGLAWAARIAAPLAAIVVSGGFFGLAHLPALRVVLYAGAALLAFTYLTVGVGLLASVRRATSPSMEAPTG
jgi:hypothetical protein